MLNYLAARSCSIAEESRQKTMAYFQMLLNILVFTTVLWSKYEADASSVSYTQPQPFIGTSGEVYHMELDLYKNDGSIVFSTVDYLQTTDGKTSTFLIPSQGSPVTGFKQLNSTHIAFIDSKHSVIDIVNRRNNQLVTIAGTYDHYAGGGGGYVEGKVGIGMLNNPWGIEIDVRNPGKLLVSDRYNNALRSVNLRTGELATVTRFGLDRPTEMLWHNDKLFITNEHYISQVSWANNGDVSNSNIVGTTSYGYVNGNFIAARFRDPYGLAEIESDRHLVADFSNKKLRQLDMENRNVGPVCFEGDKSCTTGTPLQFRPLSLLKVGNEVYIGASPINIYKIRVKGSAIPSQVNCPYNNITATTDPGNVTAEVRLHSGNSAILHPGIYQFRKKYQSAVCIYYVHVFRSKASGVENCPYQNRTSYVKPGQETTEVRLHGGYVGDFTPGVHWFRGNYGLVECSYYVHVLITSVARTAVFRAQYDVKCDVLDDRSTRGFLKSLLEHRRSQLQKICGEDCSTTNQEPWYTCEKDLLTVNWPTDRVFSVDTNELPQSFSKPLKERISNSQGIRSFEITIFTHQPPVIPAKTNSQGESIQIALWTSCIDKTQTYNSEQDICA